jgi:hypothetical protein
MGAMQTTVSHALYHARIEVLLAEARNASLNDDAAWVHVLTNLHSPEEIRYAGQQGAKVNAVLPGDVGVLSKTLNTYPLPMLEALFEIGLDPNQSVDQASPLFACLEIKSTAKMLALISAGADPLACKAGRSLLYHALLDSAFGFARKLYPHASDFAGEQQDGKTLLHAFLEYRHFRVGIDTLWWAHKLLPTDQFFVTDASGTSPEDLTRILLEKLRPSPYAMDLKSLLQARLENQPLPEMMEAHLSTPPKRFAHLSHSQQTGLMPAKNRREVKKCLRDGWAINAEDDRGRNILWHMADRGSKNACLHLLEHGASMASMDQLSGDSVLHRMAKHNMPEALSVCLQQTLFLEARNETGETPLFEAVRHGHWKMTQLLLETGALPGGVDRRGRGLIEIALDCQNEKGVLNTLSLLLEAGLDPSSLLDTKTSQARLNHVLDRFVLPAKAIFQAEKLQQVAPRSDASPRPRF